MARPTRTVPALSLGLVALALVTGRAAVARAEPWFGWDQNRTEDLWADGDLDTEDVVDGSHIRHTHIGAGDVRAGSWITLGGFLREIQGDKTDIGVFVIAGLALDKAAQGKVHRFERPLDSSADGDPLRSLLGMTQPPPPLPVAPAPPQPPAPSPPPVAQEPLLITPSSARRAVAAAWRASGLGVDDARIDSMIARARASALLPETRLRAMQLVNDTSKAGAIPDGTNTYDAAGASTWLEARLTWRLDRLIFADDEPTLERVRLERQDARTRVATRVLDLLYQWQRAWLSVRAAVVGTREALDASLRVAEAEATLDVLTAGWFSAWLAKATNPAKGTESP
jgi:hypothetical protein